jgi:hypothetical protein
MDIAVWTCVINGQQDLFECVKIKMAKRTNCMEMKVQR